MDVPARAVYENVKQAGRVDVEELASLMQTKQITAGRHRPDPANSIKAIGFGHSAFHDAVGVAVAIKNVSTACIAAGGIKEVDLVRGSISDNQVTVRIHDE